MKKNSGIHEIFNKKSGKKYKTRGENSPRTSMTVDQVLWVIVLRETEGLTYRKLAENFPITEVGAG